jgi:hypothetical protein
VNEQLLHTVVAAAGLISGLIGTYVGLLNRALLAEVRKELAELENRIITRINGTYARRAEIELRTEHLHERLTELAEDVKKMNAAGD